MADLEKIREKLKNKLKKERYQHTLGVMYTSAALAMAYHYDMDKAMIAGLLHDCAKNVPNKKKLELRIQQAINFQIYPGHPPPAF